MKYGYTPVLAHDSKGRTLKRPLLELELIGEKTNVKGVGLIDSGADMTLINIEYAKELGISLDPKHSKSFIGINGEPIPCFIATVSIKVKDLGAPVDIVAGFIESATVDILLGQEGFFDAFRIKFEKDHNTFELHVPRK